MTVSVSACVITRDDESQIRRCPESLSWADEAVVVVDERSRDLLLRPPARFLRAYVLEGGFRDGVPGLAIAAVSAFHVFLRFAKLWEPEHVARRRGA